MTKLLFLVVIVVIAVLYSIIKEFVRKSKAGGGAAGSAKPGESPIDFMVVLSSPLQFPEGELWTTLMDSFREQWGTQIVCAEMSKFSDPSKGLRQFLLTDRVDQIHLMHIGQPIGDDMVQLMLEPWMSLSEEQKKALTSNKASVRVHYYMGQSAHPAKQVEKTLKVVLALLNLPEAVGYLSLSGQFYNPKEKMLPLLGRNSLDANGVFLTGTSVQVTQDNNRMWMHTHGMEQFGVPDLQVKFDDQGENQYFNNLIGNTALYLMNKGPVLKPGHTAELAGDGIIYRIKAVTGSDRSHFGEYGAIEIEKDPQQKPAGS